MIIGPNNAGSDDCVSSMGAASRTIAARCISVRWSTNRKYIRVLHVRISYGWKRRLGKRILLLWLLRHIMVCSLGKLYLILYINSWKTYAHTNSSHTNTFFKYKENLCSCVIVKITFLNKESILRDKKIQNYIS